MARDIHIDDYPLPAAADYKYQVALVISDGTFHQSNGSTWTQIFPPIGGSSHNVLSATHPDTVTATVLRGAIVRGNSTPAWALLALGGLGTYLRSDGTDLLYSPILVGDLPSHTSTHDHAVLSNVTANQHHAQLHEAAHVSGGGDAFVSTDLLEAIVKRLQESSGPTTLLIGAVADGEFLKRSGSTIIGGSAGGTRESLVGVWDRNKTWVNIGASFVDVYVATAESGYVVKVDFTGKTQYAATIHWNKIGTGTQTVQIVDADNAANVLTLMNVVSGENNVPLTSLPAWATGTKRLKPQAKSTTAGDDPVFMKLTLRLK